MPPQPATGATTVTSGGARSVLVRGRRPRHAAAPAANTPAAPRTPCRRGRQASTISIDVQPQPIDSYEEHPQCTVRWAGKVGFLFASISKRHRSPFISADTRTPLGLQGCNYLCSVLPGAGHATMDERADDFNRVTRAFRAVATSPIRRLDAARPHAQRRRMPPKSSMSRG